MSMCCAGLSRLSRPPAGFPRSRLPPVRQGPLPLPRQILMTQSWPRLPTRPTLAWQHRVQADGTRTHLAHLPPEGFEPTPPKQNALVRRASVHSRYTRGILVREVSSRDLLASTVSVHPHGSRNAPIGRTTPGGALCLPG